MIRPTVVEVKGVVRSQHALTRQIQFAFRADPVALDDMRLSRTARAVFGLILDNARSRGGRSRLSNATMGRVLGCCTMTIKRALATLEAAHLIRRETTAEGRIRTGIVVTWEGVEHRCSTERMALEHPRSRGGTSVFQGVEHARSTNQSPTQSEITDADRSSLGGEEDSEAAALFATLGPAAFLKAMIAKGREARSGTNSQTGKPAPAPVHRVIKSDNSGADAPQGSRVFKFEDSAKPVQAPQDVPTPPALPKAAPVADRPATAKPAAPTPTIRREEPRHAPRTAVVPVPCVPPDQVAAMVARMTRGLAEGLKAEDIGRRRVGPAKLARQLAEVRRRHGRHE